VLALIRVATYQSPRSFSRIVAFPIKMIRGPAAYDQLTVGGVVATASRFNMAGRIAMADHLDHNAQARKYNLWMDEANILTIREKNQKKHIGYLIKDKILQHNQMLFGSDKKRHKPNPPSATLTDAQLLAAVKSAEYKSRMKKNSKKKSAISKHGHYNKSQGAKLNVEGLSKTLKKEFDICVNDSFAVAGVTLQFLVINLNSLNTPFSDDANQGATSWALTTGTGGTTSRHYGVTNFDNLYEKYYVIYNKFHMQVACPDVVVNGTDATFNSIPAYGLYVGYYICTDPDETKPANLESAIERSIEWKRIKRNGGVGTFKGEIAPNKFLNISSPSSEDTVHVDAATTPTRSPWAVFWCAQGNDNNDILEQAIEYTCELKTTAILTDPKLLTHT
jgi:hypothetical protein